MFGISLIRGVLLSGAMVAALAEPAWASGSVGGPKLEAIEREFARFDRKDAPGVIVGVAQNGAVVHARGYGMANLEHEVALSADSVSESGSVAKQFTAAAVALLAVRGQLSLDDSICRHLPELPERMRAIKVRMLLNHTSGLRDIHGLFELLGRPSYAAPHTNDEVVRVMARQRDLNFEPGAEYLYSNAGYILAAVIAERVARQSFNAFCLEQVFRPRGMKHTRWRDDFTAITRGRAVGYAPRSGDAYEIDMPYSNLVGNGGLLTTVGDLLAWNASLDAAQGEWAKVVQLLQMPSALNDGRTIPYALGLIVDEYLGEKEISHGGVTSGYRTFLTRFPERQLSIAVLSNAGNFDPTGAAHSIARRLLELPARKPPVKIEVPRAELERYRGQFHSAQTDELLALSVDGGGRLLSGRAELVPTAPRTFVLGANSYVFDEAGAGSAPMKLTVTSRNGAVYFASVAQVRPEAAALSAYAGNYRSPELDVTNSIVVTDGKLAMSRWPGVPVTATPTFKDGFWFGRGWHATFIRDRDGKVTGFEFTNSSGRCRRVRFERVD